MPSSAVLTSLGLNAWSVSRVKLVPLLERATLAYLVLPNLMFAVGWLRWPYATLLVGALLAAFVWSWRRSAAWSDPAWKPRLGPDRLCGWLLPAVLLIAAVWCWLSGVGGFQYHSGDWEKHFGVLKSLKNDAWPPAEHPAGRDHIWPVCYYFGYYLPASLVGKLMGWKAACLALYLWTVLGVFLSLCWLALLAGKRPLLAVALFPFLGGLDWLANSLWNGQMMPGREHMEWWAGWLSWEYSSNETLLSWVPQHALGGWLVMGWILHEWLEGKGLGRAGLLAGLMPLWTPLVFLGLIPFALMGLVVERGRTCFSCGNLLGIVPALFSLLMLASHVCDVPREFFWHMLGVTPSAWLNIAFFLFMEVGVFVVFAEEFFRPTVARFRVLGVVTVITLLLIPHYKMGMYNDFAMRVSQPALFVVWIFVLRSLFHHPFPRHRPFLATAVIFGAFAAIAGWMNATDTPLGRQPPREEAVPLIYSIEWPIAKQYHGNPESFFFRHLSRPFSVGPHVPKIPWPPGMWLSPEEESAPTGRPAPAKDSEITPVAN